MAGELVHATVGTSLTQAEYEATSAHTITWADWTPTVTQSGAVTVTVNEAKYCLVGKLCIIYAALTVTGAGTGGNDIVVSGHPAAAQPSYSSAKFAVGSAMVDDNGTRRYAPQLIAASATTFKFQTDQDNGNLGSTPSFALANTDIITFTANYRVA